MKPKFATPGQRQMWIDAIMNIQTLPLPAEYSGENWDEVPSNIDEINPEDLDDILDDIDIDDETISENWFKKKLDSGEKYSWNLIADTITIKNNKTKETKSFSNGKKILKDIQRQIPVEYSSDRGDYDDQQNFVEKIFNKENNLKEETSYTFDQSLKAVTIKDGSYTIHGLYNIEYEDLFYKVWIEVDGETVYQNDYGKEIHDNDKISDDQVDQFLENLVTYAMKTDPALHESFEIVSEASYVDPLKPGTYVVDGAHVRAMNKEGERKTFVVPKGKKDFDTTHAIEIAKEWILHGKTTSDRKHIVIKEETLEEDFGNITMLQNFKGNKATLKLKNGDTVDVAADEAKIIAKRYAELKGDLQKKFADMLNKSSTSFLIAYKDAMK